MAVRSMSAKVDPEELPISVHTEVLGVDIVAHQRKMHKVMAGKEASGGLPADIEIRVPPNGIAHMTPRVRRGLAVWARRNLFDGVPNGRH